MSEQPIAFEEVPGSRTTQQAIDQPQRERIAYEELQPGDIIQEGDEWRSECGRWQQFVLTQAKPYQVRDTLRVRRPYKISTILEIGGTLASAQKAATQLQGERDEARAAVTQMMVQLFNQAEVLAEVRADEKRLFDDLELLRSEYAKLQNERDELQTALRESHAAHAFTTKQGLAACKDRDEACRERDLARSEVARLSTELWARKPLEERVTSLTDELAQAREASQQLLQTIADNADQFAEHTKWVVQERDYARAERDRLQEVVGNLYSEPTARQVQDMLRTWATELDWSTGCFGSFGRSQIDIIQQTMVAVIQRIETMINPEGDVDGE